VIGAVLHSNSDRCLEQEFLLAQLGRVTQHCHSKFSFLQPLDEVARMDGRYATALSTLARRYTGE
jgi:hypothetical protein